MGAVSSRMGFYSYTCAKTHLPIMSAVSWGDDRAGVVVLSEDGVIFRGFYDGYGRVLSKEGMELELDDCDVLGGAVKLIAEKFYEGEGFGDLGPSGGDPGQGHFHDPDRVEAWYSSGGFPTLRDYWNAYFAGREF